MQFGPYLNNFKNETKEYLVSGQKRVWIFYPLSKVCEREEDAPVVGKHVTDAPSGPFSLEMERRPSRVSGKISSRKVIRS